MPNPRKIGWEENVHVTEANHADRLPDTETDSGRDTAVETLEAVVGVDVLGRLDDRQVLGPVGVLLLALHLDADNLDGLVPGRQTSSEGRRQDLLDHREPVVLTLARKVAHTLLRESGESESAAPVGHLADGDGVDTLVDSRDTLLAVDVGKHHKGRRRLDSGGRLPRAGDLDRLHAGAKTHGGVGLRDSSSDTSSDTGGEVSSAESAGMVPSFRKPAVSQLQID